MSKRDDGDDGHDEYDTLEIVREPGLLWLTLNRPERLNAMSSKLVDELHACLDALARDTQTRVVVLRGAGRAFCAGLDLKERSEARARGETAPSVEAALRGQQHISALATRLHTLPQPVIACIQGSASGGGFALALASDVRIAGESARFNAAFIRIGLSACDVGVSYFLPRIVGASVASELLLTGNFIEAERALSTGLVSRVVPDDQLEAAARELAGAMLTTTPLGLRLTKECLRHSIDAPDLASALAMEDRNQGLAAQGGDFREGVQAFLEKRPPKYSDA